MIKRISLFAIFALLLVETAAMLLSNPDGNATPPPTQTLLPPVVSSPLAAVRPVQEIPESQKGFGRLPVYFEVNQGQADPSVRFIARGGGATTFLTVTEAVFALPIGDSQLRN